MAITLNPTVSDLGIVAPVLGPWFDPPAGVTLPVPALGSQLELTVTLTSAVRWLPPATGTLSLYVADIGNVPPALASLQGANGAWPFATGSLVAFYRLLPEVEARLDALMRLVPAATANPPTSAPTTLGAGPTRARVRSFALLPQLATVNAASVLGLMTPPAPGSTDPEKLTALGLATTPAGTVVNGTLPMTWLRRPGKFNPPVLGVQQDVLLQNLSDGFTLWAFDHRGRALDAGAVAAWWSWLLATGVGAPGGGDPQLMAPGLTLATDYPSAAGNAVVCQCDAARTAHLVDPHEGPLGAPFIGGTNRLKVGTTVPSHTLLDVGTTNGVVITIDPVPTAGATPTADNPTVDDAPLPRIAILPGGTYAAAPAPALFPGGDVLSGMTRDFVRIAVVDEEAHLLGVARRDSRQAAANDAERRASGQNRPSTRTRVSRTAGTNPVLLATADAAHAALLGLFNATTTTRAVLGIADAAGGSLSTALATAAGGFTVFPATLAEDDTLATAGTYRVRALAGGGTAEAGQIVLLEVRLDANAVGAWLRAWPLGFDLRAGVHLRLSGGAGRVAADGIARIAMLLAAGRIDPVGLLSFDLIAAIRDATGKTLIQRSWADRRFSRPMPSTDAPIDASTLGDWAICETGATGTGTPTGVPSGATVIRRSDPPALVDRTTIAKAAWSNTLRNHLGAAGTSHPDLVALTQPAILAAPDHASPTGRPLPRSDTTGSPLGQIDTLPNVKVHRVDRGLLGAVTASSLPFGLQERLEVAAASTPASGPVAIIGAAPAAPWIHELLPTFLGFPGAPAGIEIHGTGVSLDGPPAAQVAEYVRERTAGLGFTEVRGLAEPLLSLVVQSELAVAAEAITALPDGTASTAAGPVVAVLRTAAAGMEGLPGVALAAKSTDAFPFSQTGVTLTTWLDSNVSLPGAGGAGAALRNAISGPMDSATRAMDRRIQVGLSGAREAAVALAAVIGRARDLIYIETPAIDQLAHDSLGENLNLWQTLITRMGVQRGLHVVLCLPTLLSPGTPKQLQTVRDAAATAAITALREAAGDRFAMFSPGAGGGRAVRFASTSVIVDDVFALTGTTHLWRRGLTYDSSLAAAVFDERLTEGRPQEVRTFRLQLLADRLGLATARVPDDPAELTRAIRDFDQRGSVRLSTTALRTPDAVPSMIDFDTWIPDGTRTDLNEPAVAALFATAAANTDTDHAITEG